MNVSPSFVTEIFESCENTKETHFDKIPDAVLATDLSRIHSLASNHLLPFKLREAFERFSPEVKARMSNSVSPLAEFPGEF